MALHEVLAFPPSTEIMTFKPSQMDLKLAVKLGLDELIPLGYAHEGEGASAAVRTMEEYSEDEDRGFIYIVTQNDKAVASLVTTRWNPEDKYGKKFWASLKIKDRSLFKRLSKVSTLGVHISGITTHPESRRQGLAQKMFSFLIEDCSPSFVTGVTKSPEVVMARAKAMRDLGFRTFYGNTEVTPDKPSTEPEFYTNVHQSLLEADIKARSGMEEYEDTGVFFLADGLTRRPPDVSSFPIYIQKAFEDVIQVQQLTNEQGEDKIAVKTLFSVTGKIRLRAPEPEDDNETTSTEPQEPVTLKK